MSTRRRSDVSWAPAIESSMAREALGPTFRALEQREPVVFVIAKLFECSQSTVRGISSPVNKR